MTCGIQYHQTHPMMSSDVILDTVHCLPYRQSSRPRPVIISYRIPDDTATKSITCDTGYDDTLPISSLIALLLPAPLPASPCRLTDRLKARRHPTRYSSRLACLLAHLIHFIGSFVPPVACPAPTHAANPSHPSHPLRYISSAHLPSRPASSFASRRASRLVSSRLTACPASRFALLHLIGLSFISLLIRLVHLIHLIHIIYLIGIVPLH